MKYFTLAMFTILMSCGGGTIPEENSCGEGDEISIKNKIYCVYKSEINDMAFRCPINFPNLAILRGGTLCSENEITEEELVDIQREVDKRWEKLEVDCDILMTEAACSMEAVCRSTYGAPLEEAAICFGDDVFLGCVHANENSDEMTRFGRDPESGEGTCWIFRNGADRPANWGGCGAEEEGLLGRECSDRSAVGRNPSFLECNEIIKTADYCAAERLDWDYDATSKVLTLTDKRVVLNCCFDSREMGAYAVDGVFELIILDKIDEGRCNCSCVFDFGIEIPNIEPGIFPFEIYQNNTGTIDKDRGRLFADSIDIPSMNGSGSVELLVNETFACLPE